MPEKFSDRYEDEAILEDDTTMSTTADRSQQKFLVKWVGYDEHKRETLINMSCGGLLFDYLRRRSEKSSADSAGHRGAVSKSHRACSTSGKMQAKGEVMILH